MPRPTRTPSLRAPGADLRVFRRMKSTPDSAERLRVAFDVDQVADLIDQTTDRRRILEFAHIVELAQAERLDAQAMPSLATVRTLDQAHAHGLVLFLSHCPIPLRSSCRVWMQCPAALPWPAGR